MRQNKNIRIYIGGPALDRTRFFKNFANQDWIGINFIGSGLDSHRKISQSAHLCVVHGDTLKICWPIKASSHKKFGQCLNNQHFQFSVSKNKKYRIPHPVFCQI